MTLNSTRWSRAKRKAIPILGRARKVQGAADREKSKYRVLSVAAQSKCVRRQSDRGVAESRLTLDA